MLYPLHELHRLWADPVAEMAGAMADLCRTASLPGARLVEAGWSLLHRITKRYPRPELAQPVEVIASKPFCRLVRVLAPGAPTDPARPRVLLCAPLSGHHASLLRDTVDTLVADHDVFLTDWLDARDVPVTAGAFHLDDYVAYIRDFIRTLGATNLHVVAVCQPSVPVLAAISLAAAANEATPATFTLMGGPIDARISPTVVSQFATSHPLAWFEQQMIHTVPAGYAGAGRRVYPGFLQLTSFVMMNAASHAAAYRSYWLDTVTGADTSPHERFYDDYNAVLDMDAAYYLDTVKTVFQDHALATGTWTVGGARVDPSMIRDTALLTIEGERDDITGLGQTRAAQTLCSNVSRREHVVADCGHYGLFAGQRWRNEIYPALHNFIRGHS